jgi:hypothetical protein
MASAMKRTILERFDVPDSNYETIMVLVELPPGANTGSIYIGLLVLIGVVKAYLK